MAGSLGSLCSPRKKVKASYSLGTVHYVENEKDDDNSETTNHAGRTDPDLFASRSSALAHIDSLRQGSR